MTAPPKNELRVIDKADIEAFLETSPDFKFEMETLRLLRKHGFRCEHSGLYEDPISKKQRQFDILADKKVKHDRAWLSVECKNVKDTSPVLIHCTNRKHFEAYHTLLLVDKSDTSRGAITHSQAMFRAQRQLVSGAFSMYQANMPAGRSIDQVSRMNDGRFMKSDAEVFEKWSQALNTSYHLMIQARRTYPPGLYNLILPVLVIPNGRLWAVNYSDDGDLLGEPQQVEHVQYHVSRTWDFGLPEGEFPISHLEVVTITGLEQMIKDYFDPDEPLAFQVQRP